MITKALGPAPNLQLPTMTTTDLINYHYAATVEVILLRISEMFHPLIKLIG